MRKLQRCNDAAVEFDGGGLPGVWIVGSFAEGATVPVMAGGIPDGGNGVTFFDYTGPIRLARNLVARSDIRV